MVWRAPAAANESSRKERTTPLVCKSGGEVQRASKSAEPAENGRAGRAKTADVSTNVRVIDQPAPPQHGLRQSAQSKKADSCVADALIADAYLDAYNDLEAILDEDNDLEMLRALATAAGYARSRRNELIDMADRLRAAVKTAEATT